MKSIYKKILSIGLVGVLMEFALTQPAHAIFFDSIGTAVVTKTSQVILGIFAAIAQKFFMLGGMLIELAMKLNNEILNPDSNPFLFRGWTVFVNVADLALVVALIVIAFATMLGFESYGMKKNLWRLIVIALVVNFSLVIPGVMMDLSGMVTRFFVEQSGLGGSNITSSLASAFDISGFLSTKNGTTGLLGSIDKFGSSIMNIIISAVFIVVFTIVASVIMATIAIMLFVRYFMLTFLLTVTPIIFVSWIFPSTKKHWDDWWNTFVRWTLFPPIMVFFMWLSLTALNKFENPAPAPGTATGNATYAFGDGLLFGLSSVIQMAMATMMMIMSLIAANSISIKGSKGGKDFVSSATNWSQTKLSKMGKGTQAYARRESERGARRLGARVGTAGVAGAGFVGAKIGVTAESMRKREAEGKRGGRITGALGRAGQSISGLQQVALKKTFDEEFKDMSDDNLAMRYTTMGKDQKFFAQQRLAKNGKFDKINEKALENDIVSGETKRQFDGIGGDGAYDKFMKSAGRNAEMITAKNTLEKNEPKLREVEERIEKKQGEIDKASGITKVNRTAEMADIKKEKVALEGNYKEVAKDFYSKFGRKDFEALGLDFYDKGKYSKEAMTSLMLNDPGSIAALTRSIGKGPDMRKFMEKIENIGTDIKKGVIDGIKQSKGGEIATATNKELMSVVKELKVKPDKKEQYERDTADIKALEEGGDISKVLKWIEERDTKVYKSIGGAAVAENFEAQLKMLNSRSNTEFVSMKEHEDYQHMIRMQDSMRKSGASRLYSASKEEEKKTT